MGSMWGNGSIINLHNVMAILGSDHDADYWLDLSVSKVEKKEHQERGSREGLRSAQT